MLQKIRQALSLTPGQPSQPADLSTLPELGQVLAPISPDELVTHFEGELLKVGGCAYRVQNQSEISGLLLKILGDTRQAGVVLSRNSLLAKLGLAEILESAGIPALAWPGASAEDPGAEQSTNYRERCFSAAAGLTGVDFALAESGSLVLTSLTEGSQLSSLAPPIHIAFYLRRQVVESLEEVLAGVSAQDGATASGRSIVLVTGTSRTADIEQILIRGVHGPREVHAILVD